MARPTDKTAEVVRKIEEAAAMDCTVEEMAFYANIHRATLYRWLNEDKEFSDRIEELRQTPFLKARNTVIKGIEEKYENAMDYLKRKKKKEFGDKIDVTSDDKPIPIISINTNEILSNNGNQQNNRTNEED